MKLISAIPFSCNELLLLCYSILTAILKKLPFVALLTGYEILNNGSLLKEVSCSFLTSWLDESLSVSTFSDYSYFLDMKVFPKILLFIEE